MAVPVLVLALVGGFLAGRAFSGGDDDQSTVETAPEESTTSSRPDEVASTTTTTPVVGVVGISDDFQWTLGRGLWTAEASPSGLWVPRLAGISWVNIDTMEVVDIELPGHPETPLVAFGSVWVPNIREPILHRIDLDSPTAEPASIQVGNRGFRPEVAAGRIWVANRDDNSVSAVDPADNSVFTIDLGGRIQSMVGVGDELWVRSDQGLAVIDAAGSVETLDQFSPSGALFFAFDSVWVGDASTGNLLRIDPSERISTVAIDVGGGVGGLVASDRSIFLVSADGVLRVDPETNNIDGTVWIDGTAIGLRPSSDGVWITSRGPCSAVHFLHDQTLSLASFDVDGDPDTATVVGDRAFVSLIGDVGVLHELSAVEGEATRVETRDPPAEVVITVEQDTIELRGSVRSDEAADRLAAVANDLVGVGNVSDLLTVDAGTRRLRLVLEGSTESAERSEEVQSAFAGVCSSSFEVTLTP